MSVENPLSPTTPIYRDTNIVSFFEESKRKTDFLSHKKNVQMGVKTIKGAEGIWSIYLKHTNVFLYTEIQYYETD